MIGVLSGFAIIAVVIGVGYVVGRIDLLGPSAPHVLGRLAFFVLNPALLFGVLSQADLTRMFSVQLPIAAAAALGCFALFTVWGVVRRLGVPATTIGALGSGYVNANNIGIPVSAYVLGDASASAPVILLQVVLLAPIVLTILDLSTSGRLSIGRILLQPVRNPMIIASVLGMLVAVTGVEIPEPVLEPLLLIGAAAVPVILLSFGMSLHGTRVLGSESPRLEVFVATVLKLAVMPLLAWLVAHFVFGLDGQLLFAAVALAALPGAQNIFNFAQRYGTNEVFARDVVLITTALSLPTVVVVAALLAPR